MWRRPVLERFEQEPELGPGLLLAEPQRREHLRLDVRPVYTDRARAELGPVQHDVIRLGMTVARIGRELVEILVLHRRERMVSRDPAVLFVVPLEHREIDHPKEAEI